MAAVPQPVPRRPARATDALKPFQLEGVHDTGEKIGDGAYATVKKLYFRGLKCVGKKIHALLYEMANQHERRDMLRRFVSECELLARLHHPCIVQFLGVYFEKGSQLPVMVMEYLYATLAECLDKYGVLPEEITYGMLQDVALGLRYLHEHSPSIIHRDLSANNVLLATDMSAKISDLGVAKILNLSPAQITQLITTQAPGTPCYMPPEALVSKPSYTSKIDSYSYGVLMIHILCGEWPFAGDAFTEAANSSGSFLPVSEFDRRKEHIVKIGLDHPLMGLIRQCLSNAPASRPEASEILDRIEDLKSSLPPSFENKLEMIHQIQSRDDDPDGEQLKAQWPPNDNSDESQLQQIVETLRDESEAHRSQIQTLKNKNEAYQGEIESKIREIQCFKQQNESQTGEIEAQRDEIKLKSREIEDLRRQNESQGRQIEEQRGEIETSMREVQRLREHSESQSREIEAQRDEIKLKSREIEDLRRQNKSQGRQIEEQRGEIETSMREVQRLREHSESQSRQIEAQRDEIESNTREIQDLWRKTESQGRQMEVQKGEIESSEREVQYLRQHSASQSRQIEAQRGEVEVKTREIQDLTRKTESQGRQMEAQGGEIQSSIREVRNLRRHNQSQSTQIEAQKGEVEAKTREVATRNEEILSLKEQMKRLLIPLPSPSTSEPALRPTVITPRTQIKWSRCADLPEGMAQLQPVFLKGKVYVGGGYTRPDFAPSSGDYRVFRYNPGWNVWLALPPCPVRLFALSQFQGHLIAVGGNTRQGDPSNKVYCYREESRKWEEYLKPMPTARTSLSVFTTPSAIIACGGGLGYQKNLATVEVYLPETGQWHTADSLPNSYADMTSAMIDNTCYLLGGHDKFDDPNGTVLHAQVSTVIESLTAISPLGTLGRLAKAFKKSLWKTLPDTPLYFSTAASIGGQLLTVGGYMTGQESKAVRIFVSADNVWVRMPSGDFPVAVLSAAAIELPGQKLLVCGGWRNRGQSKETYIGSFAE